MTPEQRRLQSDYLRARKYGMTRDEMYALLEAQPDCQACGAPSTDIDHCHSTGKVRGMLCKTCNLTLGYVQDSITRLAALIEYVRKTA